MPGQTDTRWRLLQTAAGLFQRQGYASTGVNQVLVESGAPKGVLYFHFPGGKEQLATESVALSGSALGARMAEAIEHAPDAGAAVESLAELLSNDLEASGFRDGCPVATVALDAADHSEPIRDACQAVYSSWLGALAAYLRSQGIAGPDAGELAALIISSLQGALLLARVHHDTAVMRTVTQRLRALVDGTPRS